jgi:ABC-type multidrug transport system ATPase subunit
MPKRKRPPSPQREAAVRAVGLAKAYGDVDALAPLDLDLEEGTMVAVVGHNGSGKSTLLQLVAGLLDPTAGSVEVHGAAAGSLEARRDVAYLGDSPVLYDDLSVWEHLEYLGPLCGLADWRPAATELVDRLGLAPRAGELPARFSRGLRQKTALAVGLLRPARVLLVDEPFVGLDHDGKQALVELLRERRAAGGTVVVATHDGALLTHVDRVVTLADGHVVGDHRGADVELGG